MQKYIRNRLPWLLFFLLLVLNLAVFGVSYRHLTKVEKGYSQLLDQGIPLLKNMQSATIRSSRGMELLRELVRAESGPDRERIRAELADIRAASERIHAIPVQMDAMPPAVVAAYREIVQAREAGSRRRAAFMELVDRGDLAAAGEFLQREIYPAHRANLARFDAFCELCQGAIVEAQQQMTRSSGQGRTWFFGLAAGPLALLAGMVALGLTAATVLVLASMMPLSESQAKT